MIPKADDAIPQEEKERMTEMGKQLEINGEAIYDTIPWIYPSEGEVKSPKVSELFKKALPYTCKDIQYTKTKETVYAIVLGKPENEVVLNGVLAGLLPQEVKDIKLLGYKKKLKYHIYEF